MKRFFFLSIFFHGALLIILFSWEIPRADKLFPRRIIEVLLVETSERKEEEKPLKKKEVRMPPDSKKEKEKERTASVKEEEKKAEPKREENVSQTKPVA